MWLVFSDIFLARHLGAKKTILVGLSAQLVELVWYGVSTAEWGVWAAGMLIMLIMLIMLMREMMIMITLRKTISGGVNGGNKCSWTFSIGPRFKPGDNLLDASFVHD